MRDGVHIAVVHEGKTIDAVTVKLGYQAWTAVWDRRGHPIYGPLGDEHSHWIRGWLYPRLWPPHRKRAEALIVAHALGSPVAEPRQEPLPSAAAMQQVHDIMARIKRDADKIMDDAKRLASGVTYKTTIRRTVKIRRY